MLVIDCDHHDDNGVCDGNYNKEKLKWHVQELIKAKADLHAMAIKEFHVTGACMCLCACDTLLNHNEELQM